MTFLWRLILGNRIVRFMGGLLAAIGVLGLAVLGIRRDAVKDDRQKREVEQSREDAKARDNSNEALREERAAGGDNAAVVERMHERDRKWK